MSHVNMVYLSHISIIYSYMYVNFEYDTAFKINFDNISYW